MRSRERRGAPRRAARTVAVCAALAAWCGIAAVGGLVAAGGSEPRTIRDGVFSAAQVTRGERSFVWECMDCHEVAEFTIARGYLEQMHGSTVWEIYDYVWRTMPEDRPSWLRPETYADILAYLFDAYGLPAGDTDLPTDRETLESIVVVSPES
jgi:S-disulfanyl-L-cysteine oxidoreductase SoxD